MPTSLQGIAKTAQSQKRYRFRNLYGLLDEELLTESGGEIKKHAAYGVDQLNAQDYEPHPGGEHPGPGGAPQAEALPGQTR